MTYERVAARSRGAKAILNSSKNDAIVGVVVNYLLALLFQNLIAPVGLRHRRGFCPVIAG